jgi:hypothetical protein
MGDANTKEPFTIGLDKDLRAEIEAARTRLARGGERPSAGSVVRTCLALALHTLGSAP